MIILYIVLFLLWIAYSMIEGFREATYYDIASKEGNGIKELHSVFTLQRSIVIIFLSVFSFIISGHASVLFINSIVFSFPFFHDNFYYVTRNNLDPNIYKKRWMDESTTSTAIIEIGFLTRTIFVLLSLLMFVMFLFMI